ncbi:sugar-binding transcriptional regulator [Nesterenkonia cremea]|uniref:DNA-binding protein n=1 Tax=Nesterenkonia cremea TaxID=1882340 RepID=A0A917AMF0_9MICC|nr:sugar-binding domain-containing protein [Nesterenkonia cremea]GGE58434.1 DNA-binding protein [Nesterenkonia cremea]
MPEDSDLSLMAALAGEHYLDGRSKVELARTHGLSRFQVARLLDQARDEGIVRITIVDPTQAGQGRGDLAARLGINSVTVVPQRSDETMRSALARQVAQILPQRVHDGGRLGVAWSRTLMHLPEHLDALPRVDIVQLVGPLSAPGSSTAASSTLIHTLGSYSGGQVWPLPTPLIVDSPEVAAALRPLEEVSAALEAAASLDVAVVAIGGWGPGASTLWGRMGEQEQERARAAGVVSECSGILMDIEGNVAESGMEDRVIGVRPEQLKRAHVIAVAAAVEHPEAVLAAVRAGVVDDLVLSAELADRLSQELDG